VATGSKDIDQLQTLDAVINRLTTTGLIGGPGPFEGKRMYAKTKPGEAEAPPSPTSGMIRSPKP
jgi:hypothetical protein